MTDNNVSVIDLDAVKEPSIRVKIGGKEYAVRPVSHMPLEQAMETTRLINKADDLQQQGQLDEAWKVLSERIKIMVPDLTDEVISKHLNMARVNVLNQRITEITSQDIDAKKPDGASTAT